MSGYVAEVSYSEAGATGGELLPEHVNQVLEAGQRLDRASWREVDPAYASEEYARQDIEQERCFAEKQLG